MGEWKREKGEGGGWKNEKCYVWKQNSLGIGLSYSMVLIKYVVEREKKRI